MLKKKCSEIVNVILFWNLMLHLVEEEKWEALEFFYFVCVYVLHQDYSRLLSLCTSTCVIINVVFLWFKYYDQNYEKNLSYLVPPSSLTPPRVPAVDSAGSWTQSDANNFLINFFISLCDLI